MTQKDATPKEPFDTEQSEQAEQVAPESEAETAEGQGEEQTDVGAEEQVDSELQASRVEVAQLKEQYVRLQAEMDNVRKRAERDVESARKYGVEKFAKEMLGVTDSLEAGLSSAREESADLDKLREGMDMTERMLMQALEKFGVERMNPEGETFDPEYHEAMSMQPSAEHTPNTVVTVIQKGYLLNGRVLRPAMVIVSSALPESNDDTGQE